MKHEGHPDYISHDVSHDMSLGTFNEMSHDMPNDTSPEKSHGMSHGT